ncbi:hypothetical protein GB937_007394 [Aspergillus fischeri]|nr:hypothetical protein GB937_007394 [Aspergillus fischeri]
MILGRHSRESSVPIRGEGVASTVLFPATFMGFRRPAMMLEHPMKKLERDLTERTPLLYTATAYTSSKTRGKVYLSSRKRAAPSTVDSASVTGGKCSTGSLDECILCSNPCHIAIVSWKETEQALPAVMMPFIFGEPDPRRLRVAKLRVTSGAEFPAGIHFLVPNRQ